MLGIGLLKRLLRPRAWMLTALVLLAGAVLIAPSIVLRGPLKQQIVDQLADGLDAELTVEELSVGWFSPVTLRGVRLVDADGQLLLEAQEITGDRRLTDLVLNRSDLGEYEVHGLHLWLVASPQSSNWEETLAPWLEKESRKQTRLAVHVAEGTLTIRDAEDTVGSDFELDDVRYTARRAQPLTQGRLRAGGGAQPQEVLWRAEQQAAGWSVRLKAEDFPLTASRHLLRRVTNGSASAERLSADLQIDLADAEEKSSAGWNVAGTASLAQVRAQLPAAVATHPLTITTLQGNGQLSSRDGDVTCDGIRLTTPFGFADVEGTLALEGTALGASAFRCQGEAQPIALAKAVGWKIREDIPEAWFKERVTFQVTRVPQSEHATWQAEVASTTAGEPSNTPENGAFQPASNRSGSEWPLPVQLRAQLTESPDRWDIEQLFAQIPGATAVVRRADEDFEIQFDALLDTLQERMAEFVDLDGMQFTGKVTANVTARQTDGELQLAAVAEMQQFQWTNPEGHSWREELVQVKADGAGRLVEDRQIAWRAFSMTADAGEDHLRANLREPAQVNSEGIVEGETGLRLAVAANGSLARWMPRLWGGTTPLADQLDGAFELSGNVDLDRQQWTASDVTSRIRHWHWEAEDWQWYDPQIDIEAAGSLRPGDGRIDVARLEIRAQTAAVLLQDAVLIPRSDRWYLLDGKGQFQGELSNLSRLILVGGKPPQQRWSGRYRGRVTMQSDEATSTYVVQAKLTQPQWTGRSNGSSPPPQWTTSEVDFEGSLRHDLHTGVLTIESAKAQTPTSMAEFSGGIPALLHGNEFSPQSELSANYRLAGDEFRELVAGLTSGLVGLQGNYSGTIDLDWPRGAENETQEATGTADVKWEGVQLAGLTIGGGELSAAGSGSALQFEPLQIAVNNGRLLAHPAIDLKQPPYVLTLAAGPLLEKIDLTPEVCRTWLQYVSPLLAEATQVQGEISADLTSFQYPIGDASGADVAGKLTFHDARMRPGPTIGQIINIVRQIESLTRAGETADAVGDVVSIPPQDVEFKMLDGRVHHRNLTLLVGKTEVHTRGSVGLDQSLQLQVRIPIREEWRQKSRIMANLPNQSIVIPVSGTTNRPRVDSSVISELLRGSVGGAAQQFLEDQIKKLLPGSR